MPRVLGFCLVLLILCDCCYYLYAKVGDKRKMKIYTTRLKRKTGCYSRYLEYVPSDFPY